MPVLPSVPGLARVLIRNGCATFRENAKGGNMINMTITMKARPEKREELLQVVHFILDCEDRNPVRYEEIDDATAIRLTYEWNSREELERYFGTAKFMVLLGTLKVLCEKSEMTFGPCRSTAGLRTGRSRPSACNGNRWKVRA
jgi:hypothetical protein